MSFASWCLYRADLARTYLTRLSYEMERVRITREHRADAARSYAIVERRVIGTTHKKPSLDELDAMWG